VPSRKSDLCRCRGQHWLGGCCGLTPIRRNWSGMIPVPGASGEYEWEGFLPVKELPQSFNPARHVHCHGQSQHPATGLHETARVSSGPMQCATGVWARFCAGRE
jgi:hypothetical protein